MILHHVGVIAADATTAAARLAELLGVSAGPAVDDAARKVRIVLLGSPPGPLVELVAPTAPDSPVAAFARKGGGLHHLCFEVDDLEAAVQAARAKGAVSVKPPEPAVAFERRRVAFLFVDGVGLVELIEPARAGSNATNT